MDSKENQRLSQMTYNDLGGRFIYNELIRNDYTVGEIKNLLKDNPEEITKVLTQGGFCQLETDYQEYSLYEAMVNFDALPINIIYDFPLCIQILEKYYNCFIVYVVGHYAYVMVSKALNNKWQLSCWMKLI